MSETVTESPSGSTAPAGRSAPGPIILRSWPKIIMMVPTLIAALVCGVLAAIYPEAPSAEAFVSRHYIGLFFLLIVAVNLTFLLYDLSLRGFVIVSLAIVAMILALFLLNQHFEGKVWVTIGHALSLRVWANAAFYFTFAFVLLFNLAIAWIITRFNYWKVENNEIIINEGFMHEQERHPTAQARFKLVIEDIVEYGLMGSGKLVFYFSDNNTQHELTTVLRVHRKAKALDEILGRVAVVEK
jgi:membrane protein YdbS with pleckstrin-like domain